MAGEVRHHRADDALTTPCATALGVQRGLPLVRGIVKGFRKKTP